MSEDESYILKVPDVLNIVKSGQRESLQELFENPPAAFAAALTGFFASGPKE